MLLKIVIVWAFFKLSFAAVAIYEAIYSMIKTKKIMIFFASLLKTLRWLQKTFAMREKLPGFF